jgi:hypothetical protein
MMMIWVMIAVLKISYFHPRWDSKASDGKLTKLEHLERQQVAPKPLLYAWRVMNAKNNHDGEYADKLSRKGAC